MEVTLEQSMPDQTPPGGYADEVGVGGEIVGEEEMMGGDELQEEIVDDENIEEYMYAYLLYLTGSEALERHREEKVAEGNYIGKPTPLTARGGARQEQNQGAQGAEREEEEGGAQGEASQRGRLLSRVITPPRNSRWRSTSSRSSTSSTRSGTRGCRSTRRRRRSSRRR
jgi:hypothetical protein